ncbi:MAG: helix-turn-helix transcriptional regulator [Lentisphaerae bacterium]|nr:helix-turn-helix transcriptional regulator [Lentisphaerota bacterium]
MNSFWCAGHESLTPHVTLVTAAFEFSLDVSPTWKSFVHDVWTADYLHSGQQRQRVGSARAFDRVAGVLCLFAPDTLYREQRSEVTRSSYVQFHVSGAVEASLRRLTARAGWATFDDLDRNLERDLSHVSVGLAGGSSDVLKAHAAFLLLLGQLIEAREVTNRRYTISDTEAATPRLRLRNQVERYVEAHLDERILLSDLARHLGMGVSSLSHSYSRTVGESPQDTVRRIKLRTARQLLLRDGLSVKQCASRLGFSSAFEFSRMFKRCEGMAPRHYVQAFHSRA